MMIPLIDTAFLIDTEPGETIKCACGLKERIALEYEVVSMNIDEGRTPEQGQFPRYHTSPMPTVSFNAMIFPNCLLIQN